MDASSKAIRHWSGMGHSRKWSALYESTIDSRNVHVVTRKIRTLEMLAQERPGRLLDIGCGPGILVEESLAQGWAYVGMDLAEGMLEEARSRWGRHSRVSFQVGDAERIPAPDNSFDAITCLGVIEYVTDLEATIREMRRVLKPGGVAIVSNHNRIHLDALAIKLLTPLRWVTLPIVRLLKRSKPDDLKRLLMQPDEVDGHYVKGGFTVDGFAFYHFTPLPYPFTVLMPQASHAVNHRFEARHGSRGLGFLAHGYIGKYRKPR